MKKTSVLVLTLAFFAGCGRHDTSNNNARIDNASTQIRGSDKTAENSIGELLRGKWQSTDDKSNYLEFTENLRREIADGMENWDEENYALSSQCENETDKNSVGDKNEQRYISCIKSDLCWYIDNVDANNLTLVYMGRGNKLTYTRTK